MKRILSILIASALLSGSFNAAVFAQDTAAYKPVQVQTSYAGTRRMESLDRGLVAAKTTDGVFLSWRLLGTESSTSTILSSPSFNVYRDGKKIATVDTSTNYLDPSGTSSSEYQVAPVSNGSEGEKSASVKTFASGSDYFDIPLQKPADVTLTQTYYNEDGSSYTADVTYSYEAGDASCGDLDGDGEYEIVVKWDANPQDNSNGGVTGPVHLDAYKLNGTRLWSQSIDLGKNIRGGAHYTQFMVYDLDGDGKAEIACKTAPGSMDGKGSPVTAASLDTKIQSADNTADYRTDAGYILSGPEYYTVFSGQDGSALDTIEYPALRGTDANNTLNPVWGDGYGNRVDRFLADIAYLDGVNPSIISWRGYYGGKEGPGRTAISTMTFHDGRIELGKSFDTWSSAKTGYTAGNEDYIGQGNHNMTVADVDNDGKDEFLSGALCFDDDLTLKWCSGRGHGDALHIGDYDPTHPGLEYFSVHEGGGYETMNGTQADFGMTVYDAATGEELYHNGANKDTGRGVMANVGSGGYYQFWGSGTFMSEGNGVFSSTSVSGASSNFRVFWDGDLYDELLDGTNITAWNGSSMKNIFSAAGCVKVNGTKSNPSLQADLFGDWREEVVYPLKDHSALRVFTTTILTDYKMPTLMHDPVYRSGVAAQNTAYNQPPHIGFYLSDDLFKPQIDELKITKAPSKTVYGVGEALDFSDLQLQAHYNDGTSEFITNYTLTGYNALNAGRQNVTLAYRGIELLIPIEVQSPLIFSANRVTGVSRQEESIIIPNSFEDTAITEIAAGAFKDCAQIKHLTISNNIKKIGKGAFDGCADLTISCYEGSAAHLYALENDIAVEVIPAPVDTLVSTTFSSPQDYTDLAQNGGLMMAQGGTPQSKLIENIQYNVGSRVDKQGKPAGDGTSGFSVLSDEQNLYLEARAGRFAGNGRHAYIAFPDVEAFSPESNYVFETDLLFQDQDGREIKMTISDGSNSAAVVSKQAFGLESDTWYHYQLVLFDQTALEVISASDGTVVSMNTHAVDVSKISKIEFTQNGGSYGNGQYSAVSLDNMKLYATIAAATLCTFYVTDSSGMPIPNASISINDGMLSAVTDNLGMAKLPVLPGIYNVQVSALDHQTKTETLSALGQSLSKKIMLDSFAPSVDSIQLSPESLTLYPRAEGVVKPVIRPSAAENIPLNWSSSNEACAVVSNGKVIAIAPGTATITAATEDNSVSATCEVTVLDPATVSPTHIQISNGLDTVYKSSDGEAVNAAFTAQVYSEQGILADQKITWSLESETDGIQVSASGILTIEENAPLGQITLRASCTDNAAVTTTKEITIAQLAAQKQNELSIDFNQNSYDDFFLGQGTETVQQTIGDITYSIIGRGQGGDGTTAFALQTSNLGRFLEVRAGRFSNNNRQPVMTIANAPAFQNGYVFEMDLSYPKTGFNQDMSINLSDGRNAYTINMESLGLSYDTLYRYKLIYSNGAYTQIISDQKGRILAVTPVTCKLATVSKIDFTVAGNFVDSSKAAVRIANISLYETAASLSDVMILAKDASGQPVEGATVQIGELSKVTNENGVASFSLPIGVYTATVRTEQGATQSLKLTSTGETIRTEAVLGLPEQAVLSNTLTIHNGTLSGGLYAKLYSNITDPQEVKATLAVYDGSSFVGLVSQDLLLVPGDNTVSFTNVHFEQAGDAPTVKLFMLDSFSNMIPQTVALTVPVQ